MAEDSRSRPADISAAGAGGAEPPHHHTIAEVGAEALHKIYSFGEELAHGITHGIGAVLAIAGLCLMVVKATLYGEARDIVAASIFGAALILMYAASTLFHSIPLPGPKHVLRVIDHCLIYVLIAATYTPFTLITLHGTVYGWPLFAFTWGLAAIGIVFKIFTTGRFEWLSLAVYLAMGWCGVVAAKPILHKVADGGLWLLLSGGLAYTVGTVFYAMEKLRYHHAIWHGFVLAGSVSHFFCVLWYVLPSAL